MNGKAGITHRWGRTSTPWARSVRFAKIQKGRTTGSAVTTPGV